MDFDPSTFSQINVLIADLQALIRQPSISSENYGILECAKLVGKLMKNAGIDSQLLFLQNKKVPPLVFGEVKSKKNPKGKTLLFYNHYDTQPVRSISLWKYHPFSGTVVGNKIFGRGSSDDKGEIVTRIRAIANQLKASRDVPCNIKLIIEGEEEIGSPHLKEYLLAYGNKLRCDAVIWESGYINEVGRPIITLGMKGLLYVELTAKGPVMDIHSSLAVLIHNPVWTLVNALITIWNDRTGELRIKDWYKEVIEFTPEELRALKDEPFNEQMLRRTYGITKLMNDVTGTEIQKALAGKTTCNIGCICSGNRCKHSETILPSRATVRIDFRLVPDMDPKIQYQRLRSHLDANGFRDIDMKLISGIPAAKTSIHHPLVKTAFDSAKEAYHKLPIIRISSSGSGPMYLFVKLLSAPCISLGSTYIFSNIHSIDEFARIDLLQSGVRSIINMINLFSAQKSDKPSVFCNDDHYSPFKFSPTILLR